MTKEGINLLSFWYFNYVIFYFIVFEKLCLFVLTMQGFLNDRDDFLN